MTIKEINSFPPTEKGVADFGARLKLLGLDFHLDDPPSQVVNARGERIFTTRQSEAIVGFLARSAAHLGWDSVWDAYAKTYDTN